MNYLKGIYKNSKNEWLFAPIEKVQNAKDSIIVSDADDKRKDDIDLPAVGLSVTELEQQQVFEEQEQDVQKVKKVKTNKK